VRGYLIEVLDSSPPILGLSLRRDRRAPRLARRALEKALAGGSIGGPTLEDARLIASELINDAVLHSECSADDIIRVAARLDDGLLIISVDHPSVVPPLPEHGHEDEPEPRRLSRRVLERLAARWGVERTDVHRIWAAVPVGTA
jgi:anti-sigma regulatory factor (Ser/Thr protein kinase)